MQSISKFLGSKTFFWLIVSLLIVQAAWIAITARYPQAFDEQVHFGLIQLHAHSWLPFFTNQPAGADAYGAVVRDPSYLYHYLFSIPYRLLTHITGNQVTQIIILRLLNIALLTSALPIFRRILQRLGLSATLTNGVLFIFIITPVVPLLASQITYDNMMVPLTGLLILLCLRLQQTIRSHETVRWPLPLAIIITACLGSLVKYPFLPIASVAILYVIWHLIRTRKNIQRPAFTLKTVLLVVVCLLSIGLFMERYAVNFVRYHSPTPECDQVITEKQCESYSPWLRNRVFADQFDTPSLAKTAIYPGSWLGQMVEESLFAIGSGFNSGVDITRNNFGTVDYWSGRSLPVPRLMVIVGSIITAAAVLWQAKKLLQHPAVRLSLLFALVYAMILFLLNLSDFLHIGVVTAVHGRYLVPVLPILMGVGVLALSQLLHQTKVQKTFKPKQQLVTALVVVIIFWSQGGGLITYFVRSQSRWFWPQISPAQTVNKQMQDLLKPFVIGSRQT